MIFKLGLLSFAVQRQNSLSGKLYRRMRKPYLSAEHQNARAAILRERDPLRLYCSPMPWRTEKTLPLAIAVLVVIVIAYAALTYRSIRELIDASFEPVHAHEVLAELKEVLQSVTDAEAGQRGYLLIGNTVYLEPYEAAVARVDQHMARLKDLTAGYTEYERLVSRIEVLMAVRLALLRKGLALRQAQGFEAARTWAALSEGREAMKSFRAAVGELADETKTLLRHSKRDTRQAGREALFGLALGAGISLALIVAVHYLIRRDLLERERTASALRAAHDELERRVEERTLELARSNRELQDFAFVASHDLQEPLRKVQAFSGRLKDKYGGVLEAEGRDYLERMISAARRMHTLINDLLTFSRVTTKGQPFIPVALEEVARQVVGDLEARIEASGGKVELSPLPAIEADPVQMRQLLQNLIGNALKFHLPGKPPMVRVAGAILEGAESTEEASAPKGFCQITVQDDGIGIDEQYLDKIFTPFQRLHGRGQYEGTGIGLAICRKIVERHGGRISVTSTAGAGCIFSVTLPLTHAGEAGGESTQT